MKGLKIEIQQIQPYSGSKGTDYLLIGLLIIAGLCLLPLLIVLWGYNLLFPRKKLEVENAWSVISTGTEFKLKYQWIDLDEMPESIRQYFDERPLVVFDSDPKIEFFEGYFTDFIVERTDGIFVQKVMLNQNKDEIQFLPLCFFNYTTKEMEEIQDLYGYEFRTQGGPNDFIISAVGQEQQFEIRLKKE